MYDPDSTQPAPRDNQSGAPLNRATPMQPYGVLPPPPQTALTNRRRERLRGALSTLAIILVAPLLAYAITVFVFQSYEVDGPSMETTLQHRDRLIIWKLPRTLAKITKHPYIPKRGDVVVFTMKGLYDFNSNKEKQLIKRVVALPGEEIEVKNNRITVYNKARPDGFAVDTEGGYQVPSSEASGSVDRFTIPAGEVFVVGDNRNNSLDSRSFGSVPVGDIVGILTARVLPISKAQRY